MTVTVTHATAATGTNDGSKEISVNAWNEGHTISGQAGNAGKYLATNGSATSWASGLATNALLYGATGDGSTDDRAAINSAIDAAYAAGGGTVFLPAGTYIVSGTGTASQGAIVLKSGVALIGAGMGQTTLKLKDAMGSDVTGLVRTPSGVSSRSVRLADLTVDGNRANNAANTIIGFFTGVNPSLSITGISVSGTTATATTAASHGLSNGATVSIFNTTQAGLTGDFTITVTGSTTFTFTVAGGLSSETSSPAYIWYYGTSLANAYCYDISGDRVEIKNCTDYGFDPHERCRRLVFRDCVSHDNGKDGFVADYLVDSAFVNCTAYSNDRHGFNLTTATNSFRVEGCRAYSNGAASNGNGLVIQRGSNNFPFPGNIEVLGGQFYQNTRDGILLQMANTVVIGGVQSYQNGWAGLHLYGASYCEIACNLIRDNSQTTNNSKDEIYIQEYDDSAGASGQHFGSGYNLIGPNNIRSTLTNKAKYSIEEASDTSGNNRYLFNATSGAATADYSIAASTSMLLRPYAGSGNVSLTATISWTGTTAPSGTTNHSYTYQKSGHSVVAQFRLDYAVAGSALTGVDIDLPTAMPPPLDMTNVSNGSMITAGTAYFTTNLTNNTSSTRCILVKDSGSASGYKLRVFASSGNYAGCVIQISYIAASAA